MWWYYTHEFIAATGLRCVADKTPHDIKPLGEIKSWTILSEMAASQRHQMLTPIKKDVS